MNPLIYERKYVQLIHTIDIQVPTLIQMCLIRAHYTIARIYHMI